MLEAVVGPSLGTLEAVASFVPDPTFWFGGSFDILETWAVPLIARAVLTAVVAWNTWDV